MSVAAVTSFGAAAQETEIQTETVEIPADLSEYDVDGVGVFYLPEGFEVESGESEEGLPSTYAVLTSEEIEISASRFGPDAYEAAGIEMPADLEEYSQREGTRKSLPEGEDFERDEFGNLGVVITYEEEPEADAGNGRTMTMYQVLKKGTESYGAVSLICPEELYEEMEKDFGLWLSLMELE